jgi:hypothetical protein
MPNNPQSDTIVSFQIIWHPLFRAIWRKEDPRWHICGIPGILYSDNAAILPLSAAKKGSRLQMWCSLRGARSGEHSRHWRQYRGQMGGFEEEGTSEALALRSRKDSAQSNRSTIVPLSN